MTPRNGTTISWTSYNLPSVINQSGGNSSTFLYGAHRQRYKQVSVEGSTTTTTIYVGRLLERVTVGAVTDWKHYVETSTGEVAVQIRSSTGANSTYYLLKDHLGSTDRITNAAGSVVVALSYDAFGRRRGSNWTGSPTSGDWTNISAITRRGFTGHEHLDNLTLIHMNGRVYDPAIARFLSADPMIPGALFSQSFDRFGYVWNNPATFTDSSGFSPDGLYDFDSPDGGRRRDCDEFCRAVDRMLREFVASTRENRRAFPSYLFLEPEPGTPYPATLCSGNLCPTPGINPLPGLGTPLPSVHGSPYRFRHVVITAGERLGDWFVLTPAQGLKIEWIKAPSEFGLTPKDTDASAVFGDWRVVPNEDVTGTGGSYSIGSDGRVVSGEIDDFLTVIPAVEVPSIDIEPPVIPELDMPFRDDTGT